MVEEQLQVIDEMWSIITEHADGSATLRHFAPPPERVRARLLAVLGEPLVEHMLSAEEWGELQRRRMAGVVVTRDDALD